MIFMSIGCVSVPIGEIVSICRYASLLPTWARILGIFIALAGDIIFLAAVVTIGSSWRAGVNESEKTEFVHRGIYSISRNPAFFGFDLLYVGLLLMYFNIFLLIFTLFALVMSHLQIVLVEEPYLPKAFGKSYLQYKKKVCRYFGRKK